MLSFVQSCKTKKSKQSGHSEQDSGGSKRNSRKGSGKGSGDSKRKTQGDTREISPQAKKGREKGDRKNIFDNPGDSRRDREESDDDNISEKSKGVDCKKVYKEWVGLVFKHGEASDIARKYYENNIKGICEEPTDSDDDQLKTNKYNKKSKKLDEQGSACSESKEEMVALAFKYEVIKTKSKADKNYKMIMNYPPSDYSEKWNYESSIEKIPQKFEDMAYQLESQNPDLLDQYSDDSDVFEEHFKKIKEECEPLSEEELVEEDKEEKDDGDSEEEDGDDDKKLTCADVKSKMIELASKYEVIKKESASDKYYKAIKGFPPSDVSKKYEYKSTIEKIPQKFSSKASDLHYDKPNLSEDYYADSKLFRDHIDNLEKLCKTPVEEVEEVEADFEDEGNQEECDSTKSKMTQIALDEEVISSYDKHYNTIQNYVNHGTKIDLHAEVIRGIGNKITLKGETMRAKNIEQEIDMSIWYEEYKKISDHSGEFKAYLKTLQKVCR